MRLDNNSRLISNPRCGQGFLPTLVGSYEAILLFLYKI